MRLFLTIPAGNWLPGSTPPKHLSEGVGASLPANFGGCPLSHGLQLHLLRVLQAYGGAHAELNSGGS